MWREGSHIIFQAQRGSHPRMIRFSAPPTFCLSHRKSMVLPMTVFSILRFIESSLTLVLRLGAVICTNWLRATQV
jgi:hypothetical protein